MDKYDKKIKSILSKNIKIPKEYKILVDSCIDNLPKYEYIRNEDSKTNKIRTLIQIIKISIIGILSMGACVFAYNEIQKLNNDEIKQTVSAVNDKIEVNDVCEEKGIKYYKYEYKFPFDTNGWENSDEHEFLRIMNYDDYKNYKEKYKNVFKFEEMTEEEFENNFLFLIRVTGNSSVNSVSNNNDTLSIKIVRRFDEKTYNESEVRQVISFKIPKSLNRNIVKITEFPDEFDYDNNPTMQKIIEDEYDKERLIKLGYIVVEYDNKDNKNYVISNNMEKLKEFIEMTKKEMETEIRIITFESNIIRFNDIKYEDGMYKLYTYIKGNHDTTIGDTQRFRRGKEIKIDYIEEEKTYVYTIIEEQVLKIGGREILQKENYDFLKVSYK